MATPKDFVRMGQSFELAHEPGTLFVITDVRRGRYRGAREEHWHVQLLCVVPPPLAYRPGDTLSEVTYDGTLRAVGYRPVS